jgi:citrate lyase subunit beta/citryl-CoA lyase
MDLALMRSKLFVPGSRPEFFGKALASAADALSFDLEDAVAEPRKAEARAAVAAWLRGAATGKIRIVRVNALRTAHFAADVAAIVGPGLDVLNLPMIEGAGDILAAIAALERIEADMGIATPTPILANIETPRGLRLAAEIATAHPRVAGLQIGYGDLLEPAGIDRADEAALAHVRLAVRLAASEAGIPAFDGALAAVADPDRCRREAEAARRQGLAGKSCIHPTQIAIVNAAFMPPADAVAHARRVLAAAGDAAAKGIGAFTVDGQMVDAPFIARAQAVVALADRAP